MANGPQGFGEPFTREQSFSQQAGWSAAPPVVTEGVLGRRLVAYLVDILAVFVLAGILWVAIAVFGLLTFGLGWGLFALLPLTGVVYSALTVGGPRQATLGMRALGLRAIRTGGGAVDILTAAVHALLFYVAAGTFLLWVLDVLIGMARADRRLGHDLLVGLAVVRTF